MLLFAAVLTERQNMFDEAGREFLHKPLLARMTTVGPDGYPHTVPVWFMLDGDDGGGYLLKGDFTIEEDPDDVWMKKLTYRYESGQQAEKDVREWTDLDIILIRMKVKSVRKV